jgi:hypothetical protein
LDSTSAVRAAEPVAAVQIASAESVDRQRGRVIEAGWQRAGGTVAQPDQQQEPGAQNGAAESANRQTYV